MNARLELVRTWLTVAQHDLAASRQLSTGPEPYLDVAVYHCQQAAEKALKGFLVFHDQPFEKTHDIGLFVGLAIRYEAGFTEWQEAAAQLTPYATEYRYPSGLLEPPREEFDLALEAAAGLYEFVLSLLPAEVYP